MSPVAHFRAVIHHLHPALIDALRLAGGGAFPDQTPPEHQPLSHLELVRNADAFLIAPASANTIAKLAHGLADNLLTSAANVAASYAPVDSPRPIPRVSRSAACQNRPNTCGIWSGGIPGPSSRTLSRT